jgi:hypothetical protein
MDGVGIADVFRLLSCEGVQAALVLAFASLTTLRTRYPLEIAAGD